MEGNVTASLSPEECMQKIGTLSGVEYAPDIASKLWPMILKHKWILSEERGRDLGVRTASVDFL